MSAEKRKVWVVGHKNPDTDSIVQLSLMHI